MFNRGLNNLAKVSTRLNLLNKDLLIKTTQTNEESIGSALSRNEDGAGDGESSPIFETSALKSKRKKEVISMSSISRLSTPRRSYKSNDPPDLTKVKISALLYEITERTNQLAQPRSHITEAQISQKALKSKTPKSMSRLIKLACPKVMYDSTSKPISCVSPSALKAIATQRIIELSQPRKDRRYKLPKRKKQIYQSCNLKLRDLSKQIDHSHVKAKLLDSSEEEKLDTKKLFLGSL